jgi:hypothetical protein
MDVMDEDGEQEYLKWIEKELRDGNKYILTVPKDINDMEICSILNSFDIASRIEPYEE